MEKYEDFVRFANSTLTYDVGWSEDNATGGWRLMPPVFDAEKCSDCALCWLYCPDGAIERHSWAIDYAYCKGCGICATECGKGAITMIREADAEEPKP